MYTLFQSLGVPYAELTHKRMDDRHRRRVHLHELDMRTATDRHGSVFSPFHALELPVSAYTKGINFVSGHAKNLVPVKFWPFKNLAILTMLSVSIMGPLYIQ